MKGLLYLVAALLAAGPAHADPVGKAAYARVLVLGTIGTSGATIPHLNGINTWSGLQTLSGGLASSGANTFANTGSNFTIGCVVSSTRCATYNSFGQVSYRYDNNGLGATLGTLQNFGITGVNQPVNAISVQFGVSGALGGTAANIVVNPSDTWAASANRSAQLRFQISQGGTVSDAAILDIPNGLIVTANLFMTPSSSATPSTNGQCTFQLTSNTALAVKCKGSDGVVRSGTVTLS